MQDYGWLKIKSGLSVEVWSIDLKWHCQSQAANRGRAKNAKILFFDKTWFPSVFTLLGTQNYWSEVPRLQINELFPILTTALWPKLAKTTFAHWSKEIGPWPMILGHNTKWVRGLIFCIHKFYSLLMKILRKFEKRKIF